MPFTKCAVEWLLPLAGNEVYHCCCWHSTKVYTVIWMKSPKSVKVIHTHVNIFTIRRFLFSIVVHEMNRESPLVSITYDVLVRDNNGNLRSIIKRVSEENSSANSRIAVAITYGYANCGEEQLFRLLFRVNHYLLSIS